MNMNIAGCGHGFTVVEHQYKCKISKLLFRNFILYCYEVKLG